MSKTLKQLTQARVKDIQDYKGIKDIDPELGIQKAKKIVSSPAYQERIVEILEVKQDQKELKHIEGEIKTEEQSLEEKKLRMKELQEKLIDKIKDLPLAGEIYKKTRLKAPKAESKPMKTTPTSLDSQRDLEKKSEKDQALLDTWKKDHPERWAKNMQPGKEKIKFYEKTIGFLVVYENGVEKELKMERENYKDTKIEWKPGVQESTSEGIAFTFKESVDGEITEIVECKDHPEYEGEQLHKWGGNKENRAMESGDLPRRGNIPRGKRVPSDDERGALIDMMPGNDDSKYVNMKNILGLKMSGDRRADGSFKHISKRSNVWSSSVNTKNYARSSYFSDAKGLRNGTNKTTSFSVRLLQDF